MYKLPDHSNFARSHNYETRSRSLLNPPFQRLTQTQMSVDYNGPMEWNKLPNSIKNSKSLHIFKRKVKTYLLGSYSDLE